MKYFDGFSFGEGYSFGKYLAKKNKKKYGKKSKKMNDAISSNCLRYALNTNLERTKKGRYLNTSARNFYNGMYYGLIRGDSEK